MDEQGDRLGPSRHTLGWATRGLRLRLDRLARLRRSLRPCRARATTRPLLLKLFPRLLVEVEIAFFDGRRHRGFRRLTRASPTASPTAPGTLFFRQFVAEFLFGSPGRGLRDDRLGGSRRLPP
jgi:hypothetical protein